MRKINFLLSLVFILILTCCQLPAQTAQSVIESANELTQNGRFSDAQILLERFHRANPKDFKILIAYAQVCYQNKKYETFMDLYDEGMALQPKNYSIKLDYARMLFDINEFEKALPVYDEYLVHDPNNIEALLAKAKISKVNEDYNEAFMALSKILSKDPSNAEARDLYGETQVLKSKWAKITLSYISDSQPLSYFAPILDAGLYSNPAVSLKMRVSPVMYQRRKSDNVTVYNIQLENRSFLKDFGVGINYGFGVIKYPASQFDFTGKVKFDKYAERYILLTLTGERKPYFSSLFSLDTTIMINYAASSLELITKESWNGKINFETNFFDGIDNPITSVTSYILLPRLKVKDFDFKVGYGLDFSSSKLDKFVSDKSEAEILAGPTSVPVYSGEFYPYYTPKNQLVNNAIISIGYVPTKETQAGLSVKYGFIATAEKAFFYKDTNPRGDFYVSKSYNVEKYNPLDVSFFLQSLITPKIAMNIDFNYSKNFFYITRSIALGVKVNFWR